MDLEVFMQRFVDAYRKAREFGQKYVTEDLPEKIMFNLKLNASYDKNASADVTLFPEDSNSKTAIRTKGIPESEVLQFLYRDGMVPQWVNLQLSGRTADATTITIESCGRFTAEEDYLYHRSEGWAPFHVLGPSLPVGFEKGDRFSIFTRSECWTLHELEYLQQVDARPWSLELSGPEFSDDLPAEILDFETVEILELRLTANSGKLLEAVSQMPKLRIIRITGCDLPEFSFAHLPPSVPSLTQLSFRGLPSTLTGGNALRRAFPNLAQLTLTSSKSLEWDQAPDLIGLERLTIALSNFPSWIGTIEGTEAVSLQLDNCTNKEIFELLQTGTSSLKRIDLRGTPVDDEIFDLLANIPNLEHFDVVNTNINLETLKEFTARRPELSCWPNLK